MKRPLTIALSTVGIALLAALFASCGGGSPQSVVVTPPPALVIISATPPDGATRALYAGSSSGFTLAASGGRAPYRWGWAAAAGSSLPPGLDLSADGGTISGVPTAAGPYTVKVSVSDSQSPAAKTSATYIISVAETSALVVTSTALPSGIIGSPYGSHRIRCMPFPRDPACRNGFRTVPGTLLGAAGGVAPYTWAWVSAAGSSLPPGLNLTSNGVLSGTPSATGSYNVVITVTDAGVPSAQVSGDFTIVITLPPPPVVGASQLPAIGTLNVAYVGFTFIASGRAPLTWRETGALPSGMDLSTDGHLSGTPSAAGSFPIAVIAQDPFGQDSAPQDFTIQVFSKGFTPTGSMASARVFHTATLLSDKKNVLVVGGSPDPAELYDSAAGTFSVTGSPVTSRSEHTATLLNDGKVLVTDGLDMSGSPISTAELYDPATGVFTATTGNTVIPHALHTATLLNDGTVLVTGGLDGTGSPTATAELYDPAAKTFTRTTGDMIIPRSSHTATLLKNGKVLVAGGADASAELYDPATQTFTRTTNDMSWARAGHTATLLPDGKVLLVGGTDGTADIYDPTTDTFTKTTGDMVVSRTSHTATLLNDGTVLVAGGDPGPVSGAELFDPATGTFTRTTDMTTQRRSHTATLLNNGKVLVTGGYDAQGNALATAELY